jgi:hypothetical protein
MSEHETFRQSVLKTYRLRQRMLRFVFVFAWLFVFDIVWNLLFVHDYFYVFILALSLYFTIWYMANSMANYMDLWFLRRGPFVYVNAKSEGYQKMIDWLKEIDAKYKIVGPDVIKFYDIRVAVFVTVMCEHDEADDVV